MRSRLRTVIGCGLLLLAALIAGWHVPGYFERYAPHRFQPIHETAALLPDPDEPCGDIDPNTADAEALKKLYGVGDKLAEAIITEREANGPFYYPEDLINVKGIGEKKLGGFREQLNFSKE